MTVKECYEKMGGNYEDVLGRLFKEERIVKFLKIFLKDDSKELLMQGIKNGDKKEAFRGAHTLKGVSQNLGLSKLYLVSSELTDLLRDDSISPEASEVKMKLEEVQNIYDNCINLIMQL